MLAEVVKVKIAGTYAAIDYKLKSEIYRSYSTARIILLVFVIMSDDPKKANC